MHIARTTMIRRAARLAVLIGTATTRRQPLTASSGGFATRVPRLSISRVTDR